MSEKNIQVLIIEDDASLGDALVESFRRESISAYVSSRPEEALSLMRTNKVEFVVADCLLPQMTGVDFVMKARQMFPDAKFKIILMSGIYIDKIFVQESVKKTQAVAFLKKPFDVEQLIGLVKKSEKQSEEAPARKVLYQIFSKEKVTNREKRKLIENIDEITGFDLPFVYSLLSETKSSGYLNIYGADGSVSGVAFSGGSIVGVDVEDRQTYLGELLIQSGYVTPEEVQKALKDKSNQRLGQRLIQGCLMSPHALDLMMTEQMNIRLSRTIVNSKLKLNFAASEVEETHPSIDSDLLLSYLHDWVASKVPANWLKSLYMMWAGHRVIATPTFRPEHPALRMSLIQSLEGLESKIRQSPTFNQLIESSEYNQTALYKALHFLLTKGLIVFSTKAQFSSEEEKLSYLKRIESELVGKNPMEILQHLGIADSVATANEGTANELLETLGDEPADKTGEAYKLWSKLGTIIKDSLKKSGDGKNRTQYKKEVEKNDAESKLKATQLIEDAKKDLQLNQFQKALDKMTIANKLSQQIFQFNIYMAWAKLGLVEIRKDYKQLKDIEIELMQVPPDERYDALYPFVMGLYYKSKGDILNAKKSFDKAIAMDPSFIVARRELGLLEVQLKAKRKDFLNMDLKDVVSGFFRKR